ncbi:hypothetical protein [Plesiomonas shigelloides]|uniref:hypothetical protein n=1 Tax=Plesiomonas shigelloides TaxID=703 RepID=UPI000DD9C24A|nr:hypothetical protein [Plesiomonas shigelloides]
MKGLIGYRDQQLSRVIPEMMRIDESCEYAVSDTDMFAANTAAIQELVAMRETLQDKVESLMSERKDRFL